MTISSFCEMCKITLKALIEGLMNLAIIPYGKKSYKQYLEISFYYRSVSFVKRKKLLNEKTNQIYFRDCFNNLLFLCNFNGMAYCWIYKIQEKEKIKWTIQKKSQQLMLYLWRQHLSFPLEKRNSWLNIRQLSISSTHLGQIVFDIANELVGILNALLIGCGA